jgi:hypothetical protein
METSVYCNAQPSDNRNHLRVVVGSFLASLALCVASLAQTADKVSVPLTDAARPATVRLSLLNGGITVKGYEGKEVVVEARVRNTESGAREGSMKRVPLTATGLSVEEENNAVDIGVQSTHRAMDLNILVPYKTSLHLSTVNDGDISVTGVEGEIDVNDVNGAVTLKNVSGNAVAHALNGRVLVTFDRITQKPMAFSSMNGDVDVTFPPDLKATLSISSDRGDVFSDFDVQLEARAPAQTVADGQRSGGKYRVKIDKTVRGTINGGGQEIQLKNFNGNIFIRKTGAR